jgi:hypothetical protein
VFLTFGAQCSVRGYYIPEAQVGDYAMLRAAEIVSAAGYPYFVIANERSSAAVMGSGYGYLYGSSGYAVGAAYSYPESGLLVRGLSRKSSRGGQMVFDAVFVATEIKRKYKSMSDRTSPRMAKSGAKIGPDRP